MKTKPTRIGIKQVPVYLVEVEQQQGNNWEYVFHKGALHMHNGKLCGNCTVMAVF